MIHSQNDTSESESKFTLDIREELLNFRRLFQEDIPSNKAYNGSVGINSAKIKIHS